MRFLLIPIGLAASLLIQRSCSEVEEPAQGCLAAAGYTAVNLGYWEPFVCGGDGYARGFSGNAPDGRRVSGYVCSGLLLKACTIRF